MLDLVIIGGGPAGLTAGIYAQRLGLKTALVERELVGGQIAVSDVIENYPGFPPISGGELMEKFEAQARGFGLDIRYLGVLDISEDGAKAHGPEEEHSPKAVNIATGAKPKRRGGKGEKEFIGKGVSYWATCDGPFFKAQEVMVVGGGDTALKETLYLSKIASSVCLVHRRDAFRGEKAHQERVASTQNIAFYKSHALKEIKGEGVVKKAVLEDLKTSV